MTKTLQMELDLQCTFLTKFFSNKIPDFCSTFATEILAIESALKWLVNETICHNALVIYDSKFSLESIFNPFNF